MTRSFCFWTLIATAASSALVNADSIGPPYSFKTESENGKYVFVVLAPVSMKEELKQWNEEYQKEVMAIRERYAKSGMYRNDGSNTPLWTVDWWAGVTVADDGVYVVKYGGGANLENQNHEVTKNDLDQETFSILANGKVVRTFKIREFVDKPEMLLPSVSHFRWVKRGRLINEKSQFEIDTYDNNHVCLDLKTGTILSKVHRVLQKRKNEERRIFPSTKWEGRISGSGLIAACPSGLITNHEKLEKAWRLLRGTEKLPSVDFAKEFAWIETRKGGREFELSYVLPEFDDDKIAIQSLSAEPTKLPFNGFSYAIAVFKRDRIDLVDGKVIVRDQKQ